MPSGVSGSIFNSAWKITDDVVKKVKEVRADEKKSNPSSTSRADKYVQSWDSGKVTAAKLQSWQDRSK